MEDVRAGRVSRVRARLQDMWMRERGEKVWEEPAVLIFACEGWKLLHRYDPQGKSGQLCQWPSAGTSWPLTLVYHLASAFPKRG